MIILKTNRRQGILRMATALMLLPLLAACQWMADDYDDNPLIAMRGKPQYINLTIRIGHGREVATRSTPTGGENGDGREAGFARENTISGVTLILADGPLGSPTAKVKFVRYFPVTRGTALDPGSTPGVEHSHDAYQGGEEVEYTTGNCLIENDAIDLTEDTPYHAIVLTNTTVDARPDVLLSTIENQVLALPDLFQHDGYSPDNYDTFAMASEQDVIINFSSTTDVTHTIGDNSVVYKVNRPIVIERLAARIDFCTNYAEGTKTAAYGSHSVKEGGVATTVKGFRYDVDESTYFILESITPFNLFNEQEYLFKRVRDNWTTATPQLLAQEKATNYVADPRTGDKTTTAMSYVNAISGTAEPAWTTATPYYRSAESMDGQTAASRLNVGSKLSDANVFVLAYAMENTLLLTSPLKRYATGLVLTGSYYSKTDDALLQRKTQYGFLRHQAEGSAPDAYPTYEWSQLTDAMTGDATTPMNYSIVRNNIYRVSINTVRPLVLGGWLELQLAVHDWRHVDNPEVFI